MRTVQIRVVKILAACLLGVGILHWVQFSAPQDDEKLFQGPVATVGSPKDPDKLGQEISAAYSKGSRRIQIRPGTYAFSPTGSPIIVLDHWKGALILGNEVTLVSSETKRGAALIQMDHCNQVRISGLTLSQSWQTAYQGKVGSIGTDDSGGVTCRWKPDAGYPIPDSSATQLGQGVNVVDAKTRLLKVGDGDFYKSSLQTADNGQFEVHFNQPKVQLQVGDWLVARNGDAPYKVELRECRNCRLQDVNLMRNGFAAIREEGGGANEYYGLHWQLGPKPDGASEKPIVDSAADGLHSTSAFPGPDIEGCDIVGIMLDDCIAIHGYFQTVQSVDGRDITLAPGAAGFVEGQPIRISLRDFFANAYVKQIKTNSDKSVVVTIDQDLPVPIGAHASNPLANGQGFKVLDCKLGYTRSRGILVKADEGIIEGNTFTGCGLSAISAGPEYSWNEADYVKDLSIRHDQFIGNGFAAPLNAAVFFHGEGAIGNHGVTIDSSTFTGNYGGDVSIEFTENADLTHNKFESPKNWPESLPRSHPINLLVDRGVRLEDNSVKEIGTYLEPMIHDRGQVTGIAHNDHSGIRIGG